MAGLHSNQLMKSTYLGLIAVSFLLSGVAAFGQAPAKPDKKIEVQLLWGTNATNSPKANHKPISQDVQKRLQTLPLRWTHYYFETNVTLSVPRGKTVKAPMSEKCSIEIKDLGQHNLQITLTGKNKRVEKRTQPLPHGDMLIYSGEAPDASAWFVVLKRLD